MILDNIKDLIKEMEGVLIKDPRFKEDMHFKNMVKTIYSSDPKLKTISQMPGQSYDVTPIVLSNLSYLGRKEITGKTGDCKTSPEVTKVKADCDEVIEALKLVVAELIKQVKLAYDTANPITAAKTEQLAEIERLYKAGQIKEALALAKIP